MGFCAYTRKKKASFISITDTLHGMIRATGGDYSGAAEKLSHIINDESNGISLITYSKTFSIKSYESPDVMELLEIIASSPAYYSVDPDIFDQYIAIDGQDLEEDDTYQKLKVVGFHKQKILTVFEEEHIGISIPSDGLEWKYQLLQKPKLSLEEAAFLLTDTRICRKDVELSDIVPILSFSDKNSNSSLLLTTDDYLNGVRLNQAEFNWYKDKLQKSIRQGGLHAEKNKAQPDKINYAIIPKDLYTWCDSEDLKDLLPFCKPSDFTEIQPDLYLNPNKETQDDGSYPEILETAIAAFKAVYENYSTNPKESPKQALKKWLEEQRLPIVKEYSLNRVDLILTAANWNRKGNGLEPLEPPGDVQYPKEIFVAIKAFQAVRENYSKELKSSPKEALREWIDKEWGSKSSKPKGEKISEAACRRASELANWRPQGGSPKTLGG